MGIGLVMAVAGAIDVHAGASCLEQERLSAMVSTRLADLEIDQGSLQIEVRGHPENPFEIEYSIVQDGQHLVTHPFRLERTDCHQLHIVVGVSLTHMVAAIVATERMREPIRGATPAVTSNVVESETAPRLEGTPEPSLSGVASPPPWRYRLSIRGGPAIGVPTPLSGFGEVSAEAGWKDRVDLQLGVIGGISPAVSVATQRASVAVLAGHLSTCGGYSWGVVHPRACAGAVLGMVFAQGQGFGTDQTSTLPWAGATVTAELGVAVNPRVRISVGVDGLAHVLRPGFDFYDEQSVRTVGWEFPSFGAMFSIGLALRLD